MKVRIQIMKGWIKCVFMVVILAASALCENSLLQAVAADEADPFNGKHVLVIGIDGCRSDALQAARVPNLKTLIDRGTVCYQVISGGQLGTKTQQPTSSGPGWSSILSGDRNWCLSGRAAVLFHFLSWAGWSRTSADPPNTSIERFEKLD